MQQAARQRPERRRTTAAALTQQALAFLAEALPEGWISQPLSSRGGDPATPADGPAGAGEILIISPRGRCHFLFVRAPADRWWDGGPRSVPAEKFSEAEARLARQLRAAGHKARVIWGEKDLTRALTAWGCPLARAVAFPSGRPSDAALPQRAAPAPARPTLHLGGWGRPSDV